MIVFIILVVLIVSALCIALIRRFDNPPDSFVCDIGIWHGLRVVIIFREALFGWRLREVSITRH